MDDQTTKILIVVAVLLAAYIVYNSCSITCRKNLKAEEPYRSVPLGAIYSIDRNTNSHIYDENKSYSTQRIKYDSGNTDRPMARIPFEVNQAVHSQAPPPLKRNQVDFCVEEMDCEIGRAHV